MPDIVLSVSYTFSHLIIIYTRYGKQLYVVCMTLLFYLLGNRNYEKFSNLTKVTQLVGFRAIHQA